MKHNNKTLTLFRIIYFLFLKHIFIFNQIVEKQLLYDFDLLSITQKNMNLESFQLLINVQGDIF